MPSDDLDDPLAAFVAAAAVDRPAAPAPPIAQAPSRNALYRFFARHGVRAETVDQQKVGIETHDFGGEIGTKPAIVFRYDRDRVKYRAPDGTEMIEGPGPPILFGTESVRTPDMVWWTDHELPALALREAGYPQVVCLPGRDARAFDALQTCEEFLAPLQRIVLAMASGRDGADELREELARRLGRHRCLLVSWPEGCLDACDVLVSRGPEALQEVLGQAEPYPIEGLQKVRKGVLLARRHGKPPPVLTTGTRSTDMILKLPGEGRLCIVTGYPNHGKTSWATFLMVHLMLNHDRRFAVFSPENNPWEDYAARIANIFSGKSFWPRRGLTAEQIMSDREIAHAEEWLRDRLTLLVADAEDVAPTVGWVLDQARMAVLRDGITDVVWDPWNEVQHDRGDLSETDYIGRSLQQIKAFGYRHGVNSWIVAHPKSPIGLKPGAKLPVPGPYDISGGQHWANKADIGITIYTPETLSELHVWKARFSRWGRRNTSAKMEFNEVEGRYKSPVQSTLMEPDDPMR